MLPACLGRRELLAHVRSSLIDRRWVTLVGPSGMGKSLIARHAVADREVAWVDARVVHDVDGLIGAWLQALNPDVAPGDAPLPALIRALDDTGRLSVLDGVSEEQIPGLCELIEATLAATTLPRILSTSHTPSGSPHGLDLRVEPLPTPLPGQPLEGASLELFVGRLASAGGELVDLRRDEAVLRSLLEASGGIPLVIEQLAAQAAQVGLAAVAPTDSLSDAIGRSYAMVDATSQRAFRRLGCVAFPVGLDVFAALAELPRALAIAAAAQLERHSLVEITPDERVRMAAAARRHALEVTRHTDDVACVTAALLAWADAALPASEEEGSGSDPWLADYDAVDFAIAHGAGDPATRDLAYDMANRAFGPLYTAMRPRDALTLLETVLASGDGPPEVGAQVARRAGICASEVRGTFEGLRFLDRAEQHADIALAPDVQRARIASIRAEMYLDAGQLDAARTEVDRIFALGCEDTYAERQARRTLMDVEVSAGNLATAEAIAPLIIDGATGEEAWLGIAARVLLAQIAREQGRQVEALAAARAARHDAMARGEDRIALLADVLARRISCEPPALTPEPEALPWAVRLGYQLQGARDAACEERFEHAAGIAADVVVLADSARLERDGIEARIVLADALLALGDTGQAASTYAAAARHAAACPLPLRIADAFDGLALCLRETQPTHAARCVWLGMQLRNAHGAAALSRPGVDTGRLPAPRAAKAWFADGRISAAGIAAAGRIEGGEADASADSPLASLTKAQLAVARLVGAGLTSKEIAEQLYLSPRTVDNHLAQIYRKLDIPSRSRLAAMMANSA